MQIVFIFLFFCGMQTKAFSWKAYSLLSIIASCSPDFHTHQAQEEASDKYTARQRELNRVENLSPAMRRGMDSRNRVWN